MSEDRQLARRVIRINPEDVEIVDEHTQAQNWVPTTGWLADQFRSMDQRVYFDFHGRPGHGIPSDFSTFDERARDHQAARSSAQAPEDDREQH